MEQSEKSLGPLACHCSAARQLARQVTKLYDRHMAPSGVTGTQLALLNFLSNSGGMSNSELAGAVGMDRTTLLRALKPLQTAGLIASGSAPESARQLLYTVTPAGARKIKEALPMWAAAQQEYETQIGQQPARQLRQTILATTAQL